MNLLKAFEEDLYNLVGSIQFTSHRKAFQQQLNRDVREIINSNDVLIPADKTPNLYHMGGDRYTVLLNDNVTKSYKKANESVKKVIDKEAGVITTELGISERAEIYAEKQAYITLKDHKDDFYNRPSCRLINPAKSEVGIISKQILEKINSSIRDSTKLQQWRDT